MFNLSSQFDRIKSALIGLVLILASAIIGLIWVGIALYSLFVKMFGPEWGPFSAPLLLGALFLLPIIVYAIVRVLPHNQKKKRQSAFDEAFANSTVGSISRLIDSLSATSPLLATVAAVVAGFMATRFPQFLPTFAQIVMAANEEFQMFKVKRAESKVRKAKAEYERATTPPPPDVEPNRRRRKNTDMYD